MPVQPNTFSLGQITVSSFSFEKNEEFSLKSEQLTLSLKQGFGAEYEKNDVGAHVFLNVEIYAQHNEQNLFLAEALIDVEVMSENIDDVPLQNIVAIMYSYLRPLVAQMTIFAKLPPLDLPPLNFNDFELIERTKE